MRQSEKMLYEQEAVIRPNRYVEQALAIFSIFIIVMLLGNEFHLFHILKSHMRFAAFVSLIILEIPMITVSTDSGLRSEYTKYLMIACVEIVSLLLCIILSFHATLVLVLPLLLAAQYPSQKLCKVTIIFSLFNAFFSPVISYLLGLWDTAFLTRLCEFSGLEVLAAASDAAISGGASVIQIILFLSCPHMMILLAFSRLAFSISENGAKRMENQIKILHMSQSDSLTGVFNRMTFDQVIAQNTTIETENVAIVYADANDLRRFNNELGHNAGDQLLICVAKNLQNIFGIESVYRIGGDEFVCILYGLTLEEVQTRMTRVSANVEQQGYSIAYGVEYAQPPCTLPALITSAETKMQIDKKCYNLEQDKKETEYETII